MIKLICFKNVSKSYDKEVFKNFNACFKNNVTTAILGPSGCGKTTLINMLLGIVKPDSGDITGIQNKKLSAVFQENRLLETFSLKQNIMVSNCSKNEAENVLNELKIIDYSNLYPNELSGGTKRRAAIARCILKKADIYIFDEPFKGIDTALKKHIIKYIKKYIHQKTCIVVTHDIDEAIEMAESVKTLNSSGLIDIDKNDTDFIYSFKNLK